MLGLQEWWQWLDRAPEQFGPSSVPLDYAGQCACVRGAGLELGRGAVLGWFLPLHLPLLSTPARAQGTGHCGHAVLLCTGDVRGPILR